GISAIEVASKAIAKMKLGKIDHETVCNIGIVNGGNATNVVMPEITLKAEARSHNTAKLNKQVKYIEDTFKKAVKASRKKVDGKYISAKLDFKSKLLYPALKISNNAPIVKLIITAAKSQNIKMVTEKINAGADANVLYSHGISTPDIGLGMRKYHSTDEYLVLKDFFDCAKIVIALVLSFKR
ncbi:MAG TPA: M20/M25/M40 family metallo-hydrolase, partial [Elusimicrobiales bacterium]|nr:M20/M25/M40 family metallo-hydrolase [Elusimicrobiales bacterium]